MKRPSKPPANRAVEKLFLKNHGFLRTAEAIARGIHPRDLYSLRDQGVIEPVARGLFRLKDMPPLESPDLFTVAVKVPQGVICLISALAFHELTTQIPREVSLALIKGTEKPRIEYPPTRFYWISDPAFSEGVELHRRDGIDLRVYSPAKAIADCFKFRNRIGIDVCLEALKTWRRKKGADTNTLLSFARTCRVEKIIQPYLEALS